MFWVTLDLGNLGVGSGGPVKNKLCTCTLKKRHKSNTYENNLTIFTAPDDHEHKNELLLWLNAFVFKLGNASLALISLHYEAGKWKTQTSD